jgi:hypothetical protein
VGHQHGWASELAPRLIQDAAFQANAGRTGGSSTVETESKMKSELTDVSFATAFTFELVTKYGFRTLGAPTLPSLRMESVYEADSQGQQVLVCIQHRLSERIAGTAASLQPVWGVAYYRFTLHPRTRNKRHDLLQTLEQLNILVFYAAPAFHTRRELYDSLLHGTLLTRCAFWSPGQMGTLTDSARNACSFKPGQDFAVLEPEQRRIPPGVEGKGLLDAINARFQANRSEMYTRERMAKLGDQMSESYLRLFGARKERKLVSDVQNSRERIDARDYLSLISTLLYDCYIYVAARP